MNDDRRQPSNRVELRTSWPGAIGAVVTPVGLLTVGVLSTGRFGLSTLSAVITLLGLGFAAVLLRDFPRRCVLDTGGITRRCLARRQHISWSEVASLDRTPPRAAAVLRNLGARSRGGLPEVSGGLVARGRHRGRWLLTDRVETRQQHDAVVALLRAVDEEVAVYASRPHEATRRADDARR